MQGFRLTVLALAAGALLGGCTYVRPGPPESFLAEWKSEPPRNNTVTVCSAYGCQKRTRFTFSHADIRTIDALMQKTKRSDTPHEERRAIAYAIGWMETRVGDAIGTSANRPGMDYSGSGDPTQQDCVDEAVTTTGYLLLLQSKGFFKHHTVVNAMSKGNLLRGAMEGSLVRYWPHWTAVIEEKETGQRYAVDSWIHENGENPAVVKVEEWYIEDLENLPKPMT